MGEYTGQTKDLAAIIKYNLLLYKVFTAVGWI